MSYGTGTYGSGGYGSISSTNTNYTHPEPIRMTGSKHLLAADTVPIDSTGEVFETNLEQSKLVSVNIQGQSTADYSLDVSPDGDTYFNAEETYNGTDIRDVFELTDRYVKLRVTSTGNSNDTADITIQGLQ